jgi:hypothetical protein
MDETELTEARGQIIEDSIDLETMINLVISIHYLGKVSSQFYYEVLYDEYFTLGLKLRILEKIVPQAKADKKHIDNLRRLSAIRNYFAHSGTQFIHPGKLGMDGMVGEVPDPKKPDKSIDYDSLSQEFQRKQPAEFKYLNSLLHRVGLSSNSGNNIRNA